MCDNLLGKYLFEAIKEGHLIRVCHFLNVGADTTMRNSSGETHLMVAVNMKRLEIAEKILLRGVEVDAKDWRDDTPLMSAVCIGPFEMVRMLVVFGADVEVRNHSFKTPLMHSVMKAKFFDDDERICDYLLDKVRNLEAVDKNGNTALLCAVNYGNLEAVKKLVEKGAYVDWQNKNCETALMIASYRGYKEIVEYLIEKNADIDLEDRLGNRAFDKSGSDEIAECFLKSGMKFDNWIDYNRMLICSNCYKVAKIAIENGANIGGVNDEGKLIFVEKAKEGKSGVVKALIEAGIDVNTKCEKTKESAIGAAVLKDRIEVVKLLIENGANVNEKYKFDKRMLEESVLQGSLEIVELLIDNGAKINEEGYRNIYSFAKNDEMVELLMKKGAKYRECDEEFLNDDFLETKSVKLTEILLDLGVDADVKSQYGKDTKLHKECRSIFSNEKMVKLLIERGSDVNILHENYGFPLSSAAENDNVSIMGLLIEGGAKIDNVDFNGRSALYNAVNSNSKEAVKFLLDKGADEWLSDYNGDTVFDIASDEMKDILTEAIKKRDEGANKRKSDDAKSVINKSGMDFC